MTHDQAIEESRKYLHLVGKKFRLQDGETESVKAVVPWQTESGDWKPHVCFYDWSKNNEGKLFHLEIDDFFSRYDQAE